MQALEQADPLVNAPNDDYEPPPHVFARMGHGWLRFWSLLPLGPIEWRWKWSWIGLVLFETTSYLYIAPILAKHLSGRFLADVRWRWWRDFRLLEAAKRNQDEFLRLALHEGVAMVLVAPLREELLCRGLPILLARWLEERLSAKSGRVAVLLIAALSTLVFAWLHNRVVGAMPLPQLLFGAIAWNAAWRRGLRYSILLHVLVNLALFSSLIFQICMWAG